MDWVDLFQDKRQLAGVWECRNEPSGSAKCGEFFEKLRL